MGAEERTQAIAFYAVEDNRTKAFRFQAYKQPDVRAALNKLFHCKCAYCESSYCATAPVDVEHFRPKGAILINGRKDKPGYYWLAASWDNLLPSCIDCNRARTQTCQRDDDEEVEETQGKENKFPLANETHRARWPEAESSESGHRLLLHPCRDHPEVHLEFLGKGLLKARSTNGGGSPKGIASIEVYALRRKGLKEARHGHLVRLLEQMDTVADAFDDCKEDPDDQRAAARFEKQISRLRTWTEEDQIYAGMCRQFVASFERSLADGTYREFVASLSRKARIPVKELSA